MMKKLILVLSLAFAGLNTFAQVALQERAYRLDSFYKFIKVSDIDRQGNVMFSGLINKGGTGSNPHFTKLLLITPNIDTLWTRSAVDAESYFSYSGVRARINGGFSFATTIKGPNSSNDLWDVALQKFSTNGSILLNRTYNPAFDHNTVHSFLTLPDKGYLMMGYGGITGPVNNAAVTRTDSLGNIVWQRSHHKHFTSQGAYYMEHAPHNRVILAGSALPTGSGVSPQHPKLLLLNANGDSVKANILIIAGFNRSEVMLRGTYHSLTSLSDGGFLITAQVDTTNTLAGISENLGVVAKVDSNLQVVWRYINRHLYASGNAISFIRAKELNDGTLLVLGEDSPLNQFKLLRFTPWGALMNTYNIISTMFPRIEAVTMECLPDSSILIGGNCRTAGNAQYGFYVAKVKIPGLPPVMPPPFFVLNTKPESALKETALGQSYPNPAQGHVIIPYNLPNSTKSAKILLTDITGREVGSYALKVQQKEGSLPVNLSSFRNGLYLYTLVIDGKPVATKKLAVAR